MNAPNEMRDHTDRVHQAITERERLLREYRDLMELAAADSEGLDGRTVLRNRLLLLGVPVCTGAVSHLYLHTTILVTMGVMVASFLVLVFALDRATPADPQQPGTLQWEASREIVILIRMMREIVDVPMPREVQALEDANARMHELNDRICARLEILAMSEPCPGKGYISATQ